MPRRKSCASIPSPSEKVKVIEVVRRILEREVIPLSQLTEDAFIAELGAVGDKILLIDVVSNNAYLDQAGIVADFQNYMKFLAFGSGAIQNHNAKLEMQRTSAVKSKIANVSRSNVTNDAILPANFDGARCVRYPCIVTVPGLGTKMNISELAVSFKLSAKPSDIREVWRRAVIHITSKCYRQRPDIGACYSGAYTARTLVPFPESFRLALQQVLCVGSGMDDVLWQANVNTVDIQIEKGLTAYGNEVRRFHPWKNGTTKENIVDYLSKAKDLPESELPIITPVKIRTRVHYRRREPEEVDEEEEEEEIREERLDSGENREEEYTGVFNTDDDLNDQMGIQVDRCSDQMDIQMNRDRDDSSQPTLTPLSNVKIEKKSVKRIRNISIMEEGMIDLESDGGSSYYTPKRIRQPQSLCKMKKDYNPVGSHTRLAAFDADGLTPFNPKRRVKEENIDLTDITKL